MGGARHRAMHMVQDRLPAFWNGNALISVDQFEMCRASLMSNVVSFFAWSNTSVSSHSSGCCCPQTCFAIAAFSASPHQVAALCSFMRVSRALFVSPIYMTATARDLVHNSRLLQRILVLDSCQLSVEGGCKTQTHFLL